MARLRETAHATAPFVSPNVSRRSIKFRTYTDDDNVYLPPDYGQLVGFKTARDNNNNNNSNASPSLSRNVCGGTRESYPETREKFTLLS